MSDSFQARGFAVIPGVLVSEADTAVETTYGIGCQHCPGALRDELGEITAVVKRGGMLAIATGPAGLYTAGPLESRG